MKYSPVVLTFFLLGGYAIGQETNATLNTGDIHWEVPGGNYEGTLTWPSDYDVYGSQSLISYWGIVLACRDFQDTSGYKAAQALYRLDYLNQDYFLVPNELNNRAQQYMRYDYPETWVLDINGRDRDWNSPVPRNLALDPDLPSDQMASSICNSSIGLTVTQKAYAWTNEDYDDFIIVEYTFTNTGNYNGDATIENPDNQLHDVYIGLQSMSKVSGMGWLVVSSNGGISEGNDDWVDYYGEDEGDSLRILYSWDGDAAPDFATENDEGNPHSLTGQPLSPQYFGRAVLHVDRAVDDQSNDQTQPTATHYGNWANLSSQLSRSQRGSDESIYNELSTGAHIAPPLNWSTGQYTPGNLYATDEFLKTATMSFGPYDFTAIGQSIRIVTCVAAGGISFERAMELGSQYTPGSDDYLQVLRSGRDSLFATISKARRAFYDQQNEVFDFTIEKGSIIDRRIKDPLPAPSVHYYSDSAHVRITWQDVSSELDPDDGEADWAGYRVYRRAMPVFDILHPVAAPFSMIYESTDPATEYDDYDVDLGRCYWYYVVAFDEDGLESNRFLNRTVPSTRAGRETQQGACSLRPQALNLDNVLVVPNPYHVHGVALNRGTYNALAFFNLPYKCRLRIYTQTGDLLFTEEKESESNVVDWDQISDAQQYIVSGIYIYVVDEAQDLNGNDLGKTMGKFVVIR
jgi:hypothetical protein